MLKDQGIRATGTVRTDRLDKELKLNKKSIKMEVRSTIKFHYEKNTIGVICWNDNGPVRVISNIHAGLPLTTVNRWDNSSRNHIKINHPDCITEYEKYMGGVDSLDALFSVCRIDVRGKKRYWLSSINNVDVLKSATFNVFKFVSPDAKTDCSAFTLLVAINYTNATKVRRQLSPNIIYPRKRSRKWQRPAKPFCWEMF